MTFVWPVFRVIILRHRDSFPEGLLAFGFLGRVGAELLPARWPGYGVHLVWQLVLVGHPTEVVRFTDSASGHQFVTLVQ